MQTADKGALSNSNLYIRELDPQASPNSHHAPIHHPDHRNLFLELDIVRLRDGSMAPKCFLLVVNLPEWD
jgi:hypothetical protein